jgi:hypothetical protein
MTNMFTNAATWLASQRKTHLSGYVVYRRGLVQVDELAATKGQAVVEHDGHINEIDEELESADWIVTTADLVLDETATLPLSGDLIIEAAGDVTYTWEVMAIAGEPCFRYCDPSRVSLRIHTKLIEES